MSFPNVLTFNTSKEIVLNGEQINFINITHSSSSFGDVYIIPIIEYLNIDPNDTEYKDVFYLNETDCWEINKLLKDKNLNLDDSFTQLPTPLSNPKNSSDRIFNVFGFSINNYSLLFNFGFLGLRFLNDILLHIYTPSIGSPFYTKLKYSESTNYKLKYTGKKDVSVRISFLITSYDPALPNFWDNFPKVYFGTPPPAPNNGDVIFNDLSSIFPYYIKDSTNHYFNTDVEMIEFLSAGIKSLHSLNLFNSSSNLIDYENIFIFCNSLKKENSYKKNISFFEYENPFKNFIKDKSSSFQILRTNPKLTGNIKIVIDSNHNMYLDTFEVKESLMNEKVKKVRILKELDLSQNIKRVFKNLDPQDLFYFFEKNEKYLSPTKDHTIQYDFFYASGPRYLKTKLYDETFSYFAPLYLKNKIPDYFVIFKYKGGFHKNTYINKKTDISDIKDILKNSSIVKVFNIKDSDIGYVLNKHLDKYPYFIGFENNLILGIDYKSGVLSSKILDTFDYFKNEKLVLEFNKFFVDSFEKNGLICPNIINLEFLFDDNVSDDYEMNSYFGLYVDVLELGELEIDFNGFKHVKNEPKPIIGYNYDFDSDINFTQNSDENIEIPISFYEENGNIIRKSLTNLPLEEFINEERMFVLKDTY